MPAALWPAPRTVTGIPVFRASFTEAATSAVLVQHTIIAGRLSIIALCILRSASYFGWVGNNTSPRIEAFRALMASSETMVSPGPLVELPYMLLSFALAVNARGLVITGSPLQQSSPSVEMFVLKKKRRLLPVAASGGG
jgi:hypothetical protein